MLFKAYYLRIKLSVKTCFNVIYLRIFTFTCIKNSSQLFVLPSYHSSTHSPSNIRYLSYPVTNFLLRTPINSYPALSAVLLQLFTPHNHLQFCGGKHFIQRWKQNTKENRSYTNISIIIAIIIVSLVTLFCSISRYFLTDPQASSQNYEKSV